MLKDDAHRGQTGANDRNVALENTPVHRRGVVVLVNMAVSPDVFGSGDDIPKTLTANIAGLREFNQRLQTQDADDGNTGR